MGGDSLSLWTYTIEEGVTSLLPDPNSSVGGGGSGEGVWGEMWRCALARPAVHLSFSPDGAMFAIASRDDHFVKIWYQAKIGVCVCVHVCVCMLCTVTYNEVLSFALHCVVL